MTHRVGSITNAVEAALAANTSLQASVEASRARSLAEVEGEIPALTVNFGADAPDEVTERLGELASAVEIVLTAYCAGDTEAQVITQLLEIRRQSHITMMLDPTFGLSYVWHTEYGGADRPDLQVAERVVGSLASRWIVHYTMNIADPQ